MSDGEALLRAVVENPADDGVRLVYADWLEENGDAERGEFIRMQVEMARLPADDLAREPLRERLRRVSSRLDEWRRALPRLPGVNWQRFWRGFVSGAAVDHWGHFRRQADRLFAATPVQFLRFLKLGTEQCEELTRSPYLGRLLGLSLCGTLVGEQGVRAIAACPALAGLQVMDVRPRPVPGYPTFHIRVLNDSGAFALAESPHLAGLRRLFVGNTPLGSSALAALRQRFGGQAVVIASPG
jgi:uncharacterized protein (TIGR02996 family)